MSYDLRPWEIPGPTTSLADETRLALRATAGIESPDRALMPGRREAAGPASWAASLTPREAARIRHAVDQGARNGSYAGPWTELA